MATNTALQLTPGVHKVVESYFQSKFKGETGVEKLQLLLKWLAVPPAYTTLRLNTRCSTSEDIITKITEIIKQQCSDRSLTCFEMFLHPALKDCFVVCNRGPTHRSTAGKEVIVDLMCGMAVLRGADVFMQGIMAAPNSMLSGDMVSVYADLEGRCLKGYTDKFTGNKLFVGNGIAQICRQALFCSSEVISGVGVQMTQPLYEAPSLAGILPDLVFAQNLPSIVCSHVLDPQPGEVVLDMCAAPGGKTVHIATLMNNTGRVVALDKTPSKIKKVTANAAAWGVTCVQAYCFDSRMAVQSDADAMGSPPYPPGAFDRVLLDAPCSALGQRPAVVNKLKINNLQSYPIYQKALFSQAVQLVKAGGVLVYSTCTITEAENEGLVRWALHTFPSLRLDNQKVHLGGGSVFGDLSTDELSQVQIFNPADLERGGPDAFNYDTIGFFIAKFVKD